MAKDKQEVTDDGLLFMLLSLVEEDGLEIAVTLTVNGVVISGQLVGANTYYDGIIASANAYQDSTLSKIVAKKFADMKEAYLEQKKEDEENTPTFIHLKNAKYVTADAKQSTTNIPTWWRGRISSLDGFSFESLA